MYKFGEKILVSDDGENWIKKPVIFIKDGVNKSVIVVDGLDEANYVEGYEFFTKMYDYHKPLSKKKYVPFTIKDAHLFRDKWIKYKNINIVGKVNIYSEDSIKFDDVLYTYQEAFKELTFEDGTPFGKEVEE